MDLVGRRILSDLTEFVTSLCSPSLNEMDIGEKLKDEFFGSFQQARLRSLRSERQKSQMLLSEKLFMEDNWKPKVLTAVETWEWLSSLWEAAFTPSSPPSESRDDGA
jgi:hypothetical protein